MNLKNKLLLLSTLLIVTASIIITSINYSHLEGYFRMLDVEAGKNIERAYRFLVRDTDKFYTNRAYANMRSYGIKEAMELKDRGKLYTLTLPRWKTLNLENPFLKYMHFHSSDGTSLLRMHNRSIYGDQIAAIRPMIASIHQNRQVVSGFEEGVHGLAYRIAVPVFHEKRYIGALEFGIDPEYFVKKLHGITGHDSALFMKRSRFQVEKGNVSESDIYFNEFVGINISGKCRKTMRTYSENDTLRPRKKIRVDDDEYLLVSLPLYNYNVDNIGMVIFSIDTTERLQYLRQLVNNNMIAALVIVIGIVLIFQAGYQTFIRKLTLSEKFLELVFNTQKNLVVVTDGRELLRANDAVFGFFEYDGYEAFRKEHDCICDYFLRDPHQEYLQREVKGVLWSDYVVSNPECDHKVKMKKGDDIHIFSVNARQMQFEKITRVVVVFTDITVLEKLARTDQLTGVANRRAFEDAMEREIANARRHNYPLSLLFLDIDHFKEINDTYGHQTGDAVLVHIVTVLESRLRSSDMLGRWGGEEFIILLPYTDRHNALKIAEELRQDIETAVFDHVRRITCSLGVTALLHDDAADHLIKRADDALYRAKSEGRNRVAVS